MPPCIMEFSRHDIPKVNFHIIFKIIIIKKKKNMWLVQWRMDFLLSRRPLIVFGAVSMLRKKHKVFNMEVVLFVWYVLFS